MAFTNPIDAGATQRLNDNPKSFLEKNALAMTNGNYFVGGNGNTVWLGKGGANPRAKAQHDFTNFDDTITNADMLTLDDLALSMNNNPIIYMGLSQQTDTVHQGTYYNTEFNDDANSGGIPIYYLPSRANQITSLQLRNGGPSLFFTDAFTGCTLFISGDDHQPYVYHANAAAFSGKSVEESQAYMDSMFTKFVQGTGMSCEYRLDKFEYWQAQEDILAEKKTKSRSVFQRNRGGDKFALSSTTIVGIKSGNSWKFYYQISPDIHYQRANNLRNLFRDNEFHDKKVRLNKISKYKRN